MLRRFWQVSALWWLLSSSSSAARVPGLHRLPYLSVRKSSWDGWEDFARGGHRRGPGEAPITIVEFGDYQCAYCATAEYHLDAILRKYDGEVALIYRHLPLDAHPLSMEAAEAAECAGRQGSFWEMHRLLFDDQRWSRADLVRSLVTLAEAAGVADPEAFRECFQNGEAAQAVRVDLRAADAAGFFGTPSFIVNGWVLMGVLDSIRFDEVYEAFLR